MQTLSYGIVYEDESLYLFNMTFKNYFKLILKLEPVLGELTRNLSDFVKLIWEAKDATNWEYAIDIEWIGKIGNEFYTRYYWFQPSEFEPPTYTLKLSQRSDSLTNHAEFQKKYKEYMSFMDEVNKQQDSLIDYFNDPIKSFLNSLGDAFSVWKNELSSWTDEIKKFLSGLLHNISNVMGAVVKSPVELRVYDSKGNVTGLVNGEIKEEIPNSTYNKENEVALIFDATDTYRYEVIGTGNGTYGMEVTSAKEGDAKTFKANDVPIMPKSIQQFDVDWNALSNDKGVTINIDSNGDGNIDETVNSGASFIGYNCDVNSDGIVNILDLVIVGKSFGKDVNNAKADVNKDGIVDILDLNVVGQHLGEVYK
jgi:hypothetical protein